MRGLATVSRNSKIQNRKIHILQSSLQLSQLQSSLQLAQLQAYDNFSGRVSDPCYDVSLQVVIKEEVPLAYLPGGVTRVHIRVLGDLAEAADIWNATCEEPVPGPVLWMDLPEGKLFYYEFDVFFH